MKFRVLYQRIERDWEDVKAKSENDARKKIYSKYENMVDITKVKELDDDVIMSSHSILGRRLLKEIEEKNK